MAFKIRILLQWKLQLQNLKKLQVLDLHGNRLVNLKRNQFKGLREATVLDIRSVNINKKIQYV